MDWKNRAAGEPGGGGRLSEESPRARDIKEISSKLRKVEGVCGIVFIMQWTAGVTSENKGGR